MVLASQVPECSAMWVATSHLLRTLERALPALSRGAADRSQARRPQARFRRQGAADDPAGRQPTLEPRLRCRHLTDGRRFRILCVIDDFSRECLATVADNALSGERVARELDQIAERRGYPCMIVSDNGTELTSNAILAWQEERQVEWHYIAPGKPMQNGSWRASSAG